MHWGLPVLYVLYISDILELENNTICTYAVDTAIMLVGEDHEDYTGTSRKVKMKIFMIYS